MIKNNRTSSGMYYVDTVVLALKFIDSAKKHLNKHLRRYRINFIHWYLLKSIKLDNATTPSALALCTGKDRAAITRLLNQLELQQLITRKRSKSDKRVITIELTTKGETLISKSIESLTALTDMLKEQLDTKELDAIRQLQHHHHKTSDMPVRTVNKFN